MRPPTLESGRRNSPLFRSQPADFNGKAAWMCSEYSPRLPSGYLFGVASCCSDLIRKRFWGGGWDSNPRQPESQSEAGSHRILLIHRVSFLPIWRIFRSVCPGTPLAGPPSGLEYSPVGNRPSMPSAFRGSGRIEPGAVGSDDSEFGLNGRCSPCGNVPTGPTCCCRTGEARNRPSR